jgi:hypothetical protein
MAHAGFLNVGVHLQAERVGIIGDLGAEPGEHGRQVIARLIVLQPQKTMEVLSTK